MASSLIAGRTIIRRIPCRDVSQTLLAGRAAEQFEAYGPHAHKAEFVICDQPIDITCMRTPGGWLYLVAFLDWHSRFIVSWELDQTMAVGLVVTALEGALAGATPTIGNSDQGSQFTSPAYTDVLPVAGVALSLDGRGRALDNVFTERLWRSIKYEEVYLHEYSSPRAAREQLTAYIHFYNHERLHQALG